MKAARRLLANAVTVRLNAWEYWQIGYFDIIIFNSYMTVISSLDFFPAVFLNHNNPSKVPSAVSFQLEISSSDGLQTEWSVVGSVVWLHTINFGLDS